MICAGNWKMNMSPEQATTFLRQLKSDLAPELRQKFVVLPPALLAGLVAAELNGSGIAWGGQNCYFEQKGAFTGENSPKLLSEMGAKFCLVGHSERRQIFAEQDAMLAKKVSALQGAGLTPILCVGETLDDRKSNRTRDVIVRQLLAGLAGADPAKALWIAYEPVWAIGTGLVATPEQVGEAHMILRASLTAWSKSGATTPILYGGSVKAENAPTLSGLANVDGFLIGGASLDVSEFVRIHQSSTQKTS